MYAHVKKQLEEKRRRLRTVKPRSNSRKSVPSIAVESRKKDPIFAYSPFIMGKSEVAEKDRPYEYKRNERNDRVHAIGQFLNHNYRAIIVSSGLLFGAAFAYFGSQNNQDMDSVRSLRDEPALVQKEVKLEKKMPPQLGSRLRSVPYVPPNYAGDIAKSSLEAGVDINFAKAIFRVENEFRHFSSDALPYGIMSQSKGNLIISSAGAIGIGQPMPDAFRTLNQTHDAGNADPSLVTLETIVNKDGSSYRRIKEGMLNTPIYSYDLAKKSPAHNIKASVDTMKLNMKSLEKKISDRASLYESTAASYLLGLGAVSRAMEKANSTDFWTCLKFIEAQNPKDNDKVRKDVEDYVKKVMSHLFMYTYFHDPTNSTRVTSPYGPRKLSPFHKGIDIGPMKLGVPGDPVYAVADGIVEDVGFQKHLNGEYVKIRHGKREWELYTYSLHLVEGSAMVGKGDVVKARQQIGKMGNTGHTVPNGAINFHFGIQVEGTGNKENGGFIDPFYVYSHLEYKPVASVYAQNMADKAPNATHPEKLIKKPGYDAYISKKWSPGKASR
jgi:murein DD-endopeptidase MepM/ murein hydrolase activator NlpD